MEENHYYPFGLTHKGYNDEHFIFLESPGTGIQLVPVTPDLTDTYKYKFNGFEYQDELGLNWYDYQARNYDPALGRWMNIDPLAEISRRHSPYAYVYNNPLRYIDPDGMKADDVVLGGSMKQEAFNQLQSAVNSELTLSMNDDGKLSYTQNDPSSTLSADAQQLVNAIDDNSIFITVTAENTFQTSEGGLLIGGAFMGNEVVQHENLNAVFANQEINPTTLATIDGENGTPGSLVLHEVTEAYQGALITQQSGESVGSATNADVNNPQSVYSRAHNSATPPPLPHDCIVWSPKVVIVLTFLVSISFSSLCFSDIKK